MEKYFELAEKLSKKFGAEMMCAIIGRSNDEEIEKLLSYGS